MLLIGCLKACRKNTRDSAHLVYVSKYSSIKMDFINLVSTKHNSECGMEVMVSVLVSNLIMVLSLKGLVCVFRSGVI